MYIVLELSFGSCCLFLLVVCFAVSPGTWPGGAWVPGGPRPGFSLLLLFHDPNFVSRYFHQDVSRFTVQKGLRPNSRIMYRFFTSHQPMMNEQDQVTWTNWPASKKKKPWFDPPWVRRLRYTDKAQCSDRGILSKGARNKKVEQDSSKKTSALKVPVKAINTRTTLPHGENEGRPRSGYTSAANY